VSDDDDHRPGKGAPQALEYPLFGLDIDGAGGLVEDKHLRPAEKRGGKGETLSLSARHLGAPLTHDRVEPVHLAADQLLGSGDPEGLP